MATPRNYFVCSECEYRSSHWLGRCPACQAWDSLAQRSAALSVAAGSAAQSRVQPFPAIETGDERRIGTGIGELDNVLGGGLVAGAVVLIGGEPGIGKSTLLLQAASAIAEAGRRVLYASGEESASQLASRGRRLGVTSDALLVASETEVEALLAAAAEIRPDVLIIDSVQAVRCAGLGSVPGSVSQVRESAARFVAYAKDSSVPVLLVGHVTKEGSLAGPRALEHVVDTVIQFEGDRHHEHRILRAWKNRFGPSDELGVFRMTERGMEQVANPSELLLAERSEGVPGSAVLAALEGSRPMLVEIQALVGQPIQGSPRRTTLGVDGNRVALILAVLQRCAGLDLASRDVFVNVTGGFSCNEPATDLAVAVAVASSATSRPVQSGLVVAGEIGLTGEVRGISRVEARLREAARLGFTAAMVPRRGRPAPSESIELRGVADVSSAIAAGLQSEST